MNKNLTTPILVVLLVVASFLVGMMWTKIRYIEQESKRAEEQEEKQEEKMVERSPTPELITTLGNFLVTQDEVCQEGGKPIVYFFGSKRCPHCTWEHPIVEKVTAKFGDLISVHDNMDDQNADRDVWQKYSQINQGGIPFLVLGCRYARVGSGEGVGEVEEEKNLTALVCKLTNSEPKKVCEKVTNLIEQIE